MVYIIGYHCPWEKLPSMEFRDGDPFAVELAVDSPEARRASLGTRQKALVGYPIKQDHVPTTLCWKSKREMPDFESPPGFLCVSDRMKQIIERFEPGVHQFFALTVVNKAEEPIAERWLWVVCNDLDGVDHAKTNWVLRNGRRWTLDGVAEPKLVYKQDDQIGAHFWRDSRFLGNVLHASNEAGQVLLETNLTGLAGSRQGPI